MTGDDGESPYSRLVLRSLERIEQSVGELRQRVTDQFDRLDERFVSRQEFGSTRADLQKRIDDLTAQRRSFQVGLFATASLALGLLTLVIAHWK